MKKDTPIILQDYNKNKFVYDEYSEILKTLINSLINEIIHPHQIASRVKEGDSLQKKLIGKNNKYSSINEITDIVGLRIITYFEDDIDKIAAIFKSEFDIDHANSIDKREVDADKFGYRSLHFVASLNSKRLRLTEYKKFKEIKFEVQIRSILQHSWAEIEHDLGYKGVGEIPQTAKRTFHRVAALLELADIEFVKLRMEISNYEKIIKEQIITDISKIKINKSSLIAFIKESATLINIEKLIENISCPRGQHSGSSYIAEDILIKLKENKITSFKKLDELMIQHTYETIEHVKKDYNSIKMSKPKTFFAGASILWLFDMLDEKKNNNTQNLIPIEKSDFPVSETTIQATPITPAIK